MFRALIAGLALTFFSMSYNWLSASAVSVLSNVDVPLLIVLGPLIGVRASVRTRLLAAISILFLVWYISELEIQTNLVYGLASLLIGTLLLCFGFVFIKKTMTEESEAITILVPSIAIMVYGVIERVAAPATIMVWPPSLAVVWPPSLAVVWPPTAAMVWPPTAAMVWTPSLIIIGLLSGVGMFAAYFATIRLYSLTDLVSAEFPTLISSILIQPIEAIFLGEHLHSTYIVSSIGFVIMIYLILKWQSFENSRSSEIAFAK